MLLSYIQEYCGCLMLSSHPFILFTWVYLCIEQVQLNFTVNALLYNTSAAYYKCSFKGASCSLKILFPDGNAAVLTSPGPEQVRL